MCHAAQRAERVNLRENIARSFTLLPLWCVFLISAPCAFGQIRDLDSVADRLSGHTNSTIVANLLTKRPEGLTQQASEAMQQDWHAKRPTT